MSEIKQAVKAEDWDLVIKLAEKARSESQQQKMLDAIADPAEISVVTTGRNGHTVTYRFPIEKNEKVMVDYKYDRDYTEDIFASKSYITSSPRRVNINISIKPRGSW